MSDRLGAEEQASGKAERRREIKGEFSRDCLVSVAVLMAPCQCHYGGVCSGAVSAQTDMTHTHNACQEATHA